MARIIACRRSLDKLEHGWRRRIDGQRGAAARQRGGRGSERPLPVPAFGLDLRRSVADASTLRPRARRLQRVVSGHLPPYPIAMPAQEASLPFVDSILSFESGADIEAVSRDELDHARASLETI